MIRTSQKEANGINKITDRVLAAGRIHRRDYLELTSALLSDRITAHERYQINRIFDYIRFSKLKIIN